MAYVFMTDDDKYVDGTWEPDSGENAIILHPGINTMDTISKEEGPALQNFVRKPGYDLLQPVDVELGGRV